MQPQEIHVTIGDGPAFPALANPQQRWNGWWCPRFDRATAERVVDWLNAERSAAPPHHRVDYTHAHWAGDTLVINHGDTGPTDLVAPDTDGRYPIGAYTWCWERTTPPDGLIHLNGREDVMSNSAQGFVTLQADTWASGLVRRPAMVCAQREHHAGHGKPGVCAAQCPGQTGGADQDGAAMPAGEQEHGCKHDRRQHKHEHELGPVARMWVTRVRVMAEAIDELDREVSVDSSIVRSHQHAAGARRPAAAHTGANGSSAGRNEPDDHAIGQSRGRMLYPR